MKLLPLLALAVLLIMQGCAATFTLSSSTDDPAGSETLLSSTGHKKFKTKTPWCVRRTVLRGGKQEGVELLTIDNGNLSIRVIPTRGMGILDVRKGDVRLGWDSPVKEVVHPSFVNLESRGGLGWLEGFNEWMVRCGLEFAGHPGEDEFVINTGDTATMDLTLHGKIQNVPASNWEVLVDPKPPYRIRVRGTVYEKFFYGPKLKLLAEVSTVPGSDSFRISDTVTNEGAFPQEFQLIYHGNYGSSILEANATVLTPTKSVTPMNAHAGGAIGNWDTYAGPTKGFIEEVYLFEPIADVDGKAHAVLRNAKGDLATSLSWNLTELPYLTVWKNTSASEDGYVTGIEPATGYPFNRKVERKFGRVPKLAPGESRSFTLDYGIHTGAKAVKALADKVSAIQGETPVKVNEDPPKVD
ncbi:MAG: aldose 1-epimerase family protein [Verrucomicrobia bacterium]|nr:aldose 1-epimerase family protein [Verrucomicrobiota bacterium]MDA1048439.1 aldose 1-epimerase family protein [Verrucomicrobiota bacterium]